MSYFNEKIQVSFEEMMLAFSDALNLIDARLTDHHKQVGYILYEFGTLLGMAKEEIKELVMLGLVHDIGAFKEQERNRMVSFEVENVQDHAVNGYVLLKNIDIFEDISEAVLYHHTYYHQGQGFATVRPKIAKMAQLIFLADRVSVLILTGNNNVLSRVDGIIATVNKAAGELFNPEYVKLLDALKHMDYFWLNLITPNKDHVLNTVLKSDERVISIGTFMSFTKMFIYSIDFRSRYTATHSSGVAAVVKRLSELCGFDLEKSLVMSIAGYYHDIGKLMIPYEILDKPARLSVDEYNLIRQHPYYTYHILDKINGLSYIKEISAYHHEMIDGNGYPFRLHFGGLSLENKIMTIADIFTALTEKRPYREPASEKEIEQVLGTMAGNGKIDPKVAEIAIKNAKELIEVNHVSQDEVLASFDEMQKEKEYWLEFMAQRSL